MIHINVPDAVDDLRTQVLSGSPLDRVGRMEKMGKKSRLWAFQYAKTW